MIRPKQFARIGEFHLEEAILDVLLEAQHEGDCIGPAEISKRSGIFRESGYAMASGNDNIVWGMLNKLVKEKKIERCKKAGRNGWQLTKEEFERRRDDVVNG